jgi:hypothetical protein
VASPLCPNPADGYQGAVEPPDADSARLRQLATSGSFGSSHSTSHSGQASLSAQQAAPVSNGSSADDKAMQVAKRIARGVDENNKPYTLNPTQLQQIAASLRKLPSALLDKLVKGGLKIEVISKPKTDNGQAEYDHDSKKIFIPLRNLGKTSQGEDGKTDVLLHELGHAVDDLLKPDGKDKTTRRVTDSQEYNEAYNEYDKKVYGGKSVPDPSARLGPPGVVSSKIELFAEAMRFYLEGGAAREELRKKAPKMYKLIVKLLG